MRLSFRLRVCLAFSVHRQVCGFKVRWFSHSVKWRLEIWTRKREKKAKKDQKKNGIQGSGQDRKEGIDGKLTSIKGRQRGEPEQVGSAKREKLKDEVRERARDNGKEGER